MEDDTGEKRFQPFKGVSAWFSSSVHPDLIKEWADCHGGSFAEENSADYLFSESALAEDTKRIHDEHQEISVLKPEWIASVVHFRKSASEVGLGPFLILPAYCDPVASGEDPASFCTPEMVPPAHPPPIMKESRLEKGFEPELTTREEEEEVVVTEEVRFQEDRGKEVEPLDTAREKSVVVDQDCVSGGVVHLHQLEPPTALHVNHIEPAHTHIIDFIPSQNGHTVHRRPISPVY